MTRAARGRLAATLGAVAYLTLTFVMFYLETRSVLLAVASAVGVLVGGLLLVVAIFRAVDWVDSGEDR